MEGNGNEDPFQEQLRSIEASKAHARQYLDRTEPHFPDHLNLPRGFWRETGQALSVAHDGEPTCTSRAIVEQETPGGFAIPVQLHTPIRCIRPQGHDGPHASVVVPHLVRKARWKALAWD
jgi:hypothetical protein